MPNLRALTGISVPSAPSRPLPCSDHSSGLVRTQTPTQQLRCPPPPGHYRARRRLSRGCGLAEQPTADWALSFATEIPKVRKSSSSLHFPKLWGVGDRPLVSSYTWPLLFFLGAELGTCQFSVASDSRPMNVNTSGVQAIQALSLTQPPAG